MSERTRLRVWVMAQVGAALLTALAVVVEPTRGMDRISNRRRMLLVLRAVWPALMTMRVILRKGELGK